MTQTIGRFVVADPDVCHGQPTFRGTRILVSDVLEQVATGMSWEAIIEDWRGAISEAAIAESIRLGRDLLLHHAGELVPVSSGE